MDLSQSLGTCFLFLRGIKLILKDSRLKPLKLAPNVTKHKLLTLSVAVVLWSMDVDGLLAVARDAGAVATPAFRRARARVAILTRHAKTLIAGGARDCVRGTGIRGAELRAQINWTNRRRASTPDYCLEITQAPSKRWKGEGAGSWKHRTGNQICKILHASLYLSDSTKFESANKVVAISLFVSLDNGAQLLRIHSLCLTFDA